MAMMMTNDPRDSWVVNMVESLVENGVVVRRRVYTMQNGDEWEVVWDGSEKHVCFNAHVAFCPDFLLEVSRQKRKSGKGGIV